MRAVSPVLTSVWPRPTYLTKLSRGLPGLSSNGNGRGVVTSDLCIGVGWVPLIGVVLCPKNPLSPLVPGVGVRGVGVRGVGVVGPVVIVKPLIGTSTVFNRTLRLVMTRLNRVT